MIKKKLYKIIIAFIFVLLILPCGAFVNVSASENNVNNIEEEIRTKLRNQTQNREIKLKLS